MTIEEIRKNYPDPLNSTQVREILKISKSSVVWLLNSGYLKCSISDGRQKYSVAVSDLVDYINRVESGELVVLFPKRKHGTDITIEPSDNDIALPKNPPAGLQAWLIEEWRNLDELLPYSTVTELTGFTERTLRSWCASLKVVSCTGKDAITLKNVDVKKMVYIDKKSLIDYLCGAGFKYLKGSKSTILPTESADALREHLNIEWRGLNDGLTHSEVSKITGYSLTNVKSLVTDGKVESFVAAGEIKEKTVTCQRTFINKMSLISYLCGEGYHKRQKPQKLLELLKKFLEK